MVKMEVAEVRTQTADITAFCQEIEPVATGLATATNGLAFSNAFSGAAGTNITDYLASAYPALARILILHAEATAQANQNYLDGYLAQCGEKSLDSDELEREIQTTEATIQGYEAQKSMAESNLQAAIHDPSPEATLASQQYQKAVTQLKQDIQRNQKKQEKIAEKLQKLITFDATSPFLLCKLV